MRLTTMRWGAALSMASLWTFLPSWKEWRNLKNVSARFQTNYNYKYELIISSPVCMKMKHANWSKNNESIVFFSYVYFLVFLVACRRIIKIIIYHWHLHYLAILRKTPAYLRILHICSNFAHEINKKVSGMARFIAAANYLTNYDSQLTERQARHYLWCA